MLYFSPSYSLLAFLISIYLLFMYLTLAFFHYSLQALYHLLLSISESAFNILPHIYLLAFLISIFLLFIHVLQLLSIILSIIFTVYIYLSGSLLLPFSLIFIYLHFSSPFILLFLLFIALYFLHLSKLSIIHSNLPFSLIFLHLYSSFIPSVSAAYIISHV